MSSAFDGIAKLPHRSGNLVQMLRLRPRHSRTLGPSFSYCYCLQVDVRKDCQTHGTNFTLRISVVNSLQSTTESAPEMNPKVLFVAKGAPFQSFCL